MSWYGVPANDAWLWAVEHLCRLSEVAERQGCQKCHTLALGATLPACSIFASSQQPQQPACNPDCFMLRHMIMCCIAVGGLDWYMLTQPGICVAVVLPTRLLLVAVMSWNIVPCRWQSCW